MATHPDDHGQPRPDPEHPPAPEQPPASKEPPEKEFPEMTADVVEGPHTPGTSKPTRMAREPGKPTMIAPGEAEQAAQPPPVPNMSLDEPHGHAPGHGEAKPGAP